MGSTKSAKTVKEEDPISEKDPSMEEVLASIRKMINDNDSEEVSSVQQTSSEEETNSEEDSDDIIELTQIVEEDLAEMPKKEKIKKNIDAQENTDLELAEHQVEIQALTSRSKENSEENISNDFSLFDEENAVQENLVSEETAENTTMALKQLTEAVYKTTSLALGGGSKTLEDIVKESLKPLLKEWLDENLSGMVENIVQQEIQKLVSKIQSQ
jgi:uncharacterized protein